MSRTYVGNLPYGVQERDIEHFFRSFGRLREIFLKGAYAFVEFEDPRDADDAVYELNGERIFGERVTVERARGLPRSLRDTNRGSRASRSRYDRKVLPYTRTEHRIIVENLSSRCSWQDLKDYMRKVGEVTYADAHRPHSGEGIIEFANYSDMKNAIKKLDDTDLYGRRIRLIEDRPKRGSRSSRSRRRSVSRSRSRSRSERSQSRFSEDKSKSQMSSNVKSPCRSKTRSKSPVRSNSRGRSVSRDRSQSRSRSKSKSQMSNHVKSPCRSKTRSKSPSLTSNSRGRSVSRDRSQSRSPSKSRSSSVSRDKSQSHECSMRSRSKSRS